MTSIIGRVAGVARTLREGRGRELLGVVKERWSSETLSYGLRRDLSIPFPAPQANIPITVRAMTEADMPRILGMDAPGITDEGREERTTRRQMLAAGVSRCYVAVTESGAPCYMQWLIGYRQNRKVQTYFKGLYPHLKQNEALLEGAFTPEEWRGQRIMPAAMAQLAEQGIDLGARYVITFVTHDNIPSLKGCKRSGFTPYLTRRDRWRRFRRQITFTPLPPNTPYPFD